MNDPYQISQMNTYILEVIRLIYLYQQQLITLFWPQL